MKMRKEINIKETINQMTLKEKAMFLTGSCPVHNYGVERLGISELTMLDGPNGLRKVVEDGDSLGGISKSEKTTWTELFLYKMCRFFQLSSGTIKLERSYFSKNTLSVL